MKKHFVLSYFAGCGGFSLGAKAADCDTLGIEYDDQIAQLYRDNVSECLTADVTTFDPYKLEIPGVSDRRNSGSLLIWQLSPECKKFSRANTKAKANQMEAMATDSATSINKIWWHEEIIQPDAIVLENVEDYAKYDGYDNFSKYLLNKGYRVVQQIVNSADCGDPTKRRRLIMIAVRPYLPAPLIKFTHSQTMGGQLDLFEETKLPWVGWHEAIKDLLPSLPQSDLTGRQSKSLMKSSRPLLIERIGYYKAPKTAAANEPCWTLRSHLGDDGKGSSRNKILDAVIGADVRSITPEALALFHSFPRSYKWSGKASLDVKAIGNSIPCLMSKAIVESIIGGVQ